MNIREEILKEHSKIQTMRIVHYIDGDKKRFRQLMQLFLADEYRVTQRAAWVVSYCAIAHPNLIQPYFSSMIDKVNEQGVHDAVKRNTIKIWSEIAIPEEFTGKIFDTCYALLRSADSPVAVKVHAMTVLEKISRTFPELRHELKLVVEGLLPMRSAGINSRARKTLKSLDKKS